MMRNLLRKKKYQHENQMHCHQKQKQYKSLKMVELQLFRDPKTLMREYKE